MTGMPPEQQGAHDAASDESLATVADGFRSAGVADTRRSEGGEPGGEWRADGSWATDAEVGQLVFDDDEPPAIGSTVPVPKNVHIGVAGVVIVALFFLWRSAGSGDATSDLPSDGGPAAAEADSTAAGTDSGATDDELGALERRIGELEAALASAKPPAIAGTAIRRIIVPADARFVSLGNQGLAVIGPFGGYAAIDPATNAVVAATQAANGATRVMRTPSAVWITNRNDDQIVRVDAVANAVVSVFEFPGPDGVAKLGDTLVVASSDERFVAQVDPASGQILDRVEVPGTPGDVWISGDERWIWIGLLDTGEVVKVDAETFVVVERVTVGAGPVDLEGAGGTLWVTNRIEQTVVGVDMETGVLGSSFLVGGEPTASAVYRNDLWVSLTAAGELVQLDLVSGAVLSRTPLGSSSRGGPSGMAVGAGSLWIAMQSERSVVRVTIDD